MDDQRHWAAQSQVTDIGRPTEPVDALSADIAELRRTSCNLVFHYRADGDFAENGIAAERVAEIDSRYADVMFARLRELGGQTLSAARPPALRVVGCCRDFTLLFVAMARHKGVPARSRVGFATYFVPGWFIDHVIAEVWDEALGRWRLVEPEVSDGFARAAGFDPMDVPPDAFLTGGAAWLQARAGDADPARFVVAPELDLPNTRGWRYLRHNLVHDLASLNKQEMVLWDVWGIMDKHAPPDPDESELLDELARVTTDPDPSPDLLRDWGRRNGIVVPATVTSHTPATGVPMRVDVSRVALESG